MIGLTGPRGVGKTTLVLQHIKKNMNPAETLYVTAEDFYFADNKLIDLAGDFVKRSGKYLFIDGDDSCRVFFAGCQNIFFHLKFLY